MRYLWKPSSGPPPKNRQIGEVLLQAGIIGREQLQETLERQKHWPYLTFGQLASLMHRIPLSRIDAEYVRVEVLPFIGGKLLERLQIFADKDRFARNLEPASFIREIHAAMLRYEVMHIDSRRYSRHETGINEDEVKRFIRIQGMVDIRLLTEQGGVEGHVNVLQDSLDHEVRLVDDDDRIKTVLYYGLRSLYTRSSAVGGS